MKRSKTKQTNFIPLKPRLEECDWCYEYFDLNGPDWIVNANGKSGHWKCFHRQTDQPTRREEEEPGRDIKSPSRTKGLQ